MKYLIMILALTTSIQAKTLDARIIKIITKSAVANNIPAKVLLSVCYVESNFKVNALHIDDGTDDSIGLCQIQPRTARSVGFKYSKIRLYEPKYNTYYAAKYLRTLVIKYGTIDKAIVAYNLGHYSSTYKKYLNKVHKAMKKF